MSEKVCACIYMHILTLKLRIHQHLLHTQLENSFFV